MIIHTSKFLTGSHRIVSAPTPDSSFPAAAVAECACHVLALSATSEHVPDVDNAINLLLRNQAKQTTSSSQERGS